MEFTNRIILKNNTPYSPRVKSTGTATGGTGGVIGGNYLPATELEEGQYQVDLSNVIFTGNVQAMGEVTAFVPNDTPTTAITTLLERLTEVFEFQGDKLIIKKDVEYVGKLDPAEAESAGDGEDETGDVIDDGQ